MKSSPHCKPQVEVKLKNALEFFFPLIFLPPLGGRVVLGAAEGKRNRDAYQTEDFKTKQI